MVGDDKDGRDSEARGLGRLMPRLAPKSPSEALKAVPAPPPPKLRETRERGGFLSSLSAAFTVILFVGLAVVLGVTFARREYAEPGPLPSDKVVIISRGSGIDEIADQLRREGIISQPSVFIAAIYLQQAKIQAGEYQFRANTSMKAVIDTLVEGKAILHAITIPEGLTSEQIVQRLSENDLLAGPIRETPREGTLLPDTYKFQRGMQRERLLAQMAAEQRRVLNEVWSRRAQDVPIKTPEELVILASVVEKETGRADERTRVAGVFINRLQRRMKLQSDPTIVYGLVGGKGTLGRGILRSEIQQATPYNTYVIDGLPPTPIANPGRAAMEAVANPSRTRELYFVADGTGGHAFAETLDQHNRNVARWRQIEAQRRDAQPAQGPVDRVEPEPLPATPTRGTALPGQPSDQAASTEPAVETYPATGVAPLPAARTQRPATVGNARARAVDASEGTSRDPLLNRTYDLNSPQTVPRLRP